MLSSNYCQDGNSHETCKDDETKLNFDEESDRTPLFRHRQEFCYLHYSFWSSVHFVRPDDILHILQATALRDSDIRGTRFQKRCSAWWGSHKWLTVAVGSMPIRVSLDYTWMNLFNADVSRAVNSLTAERTTRPSLMASSLLGACRSRIDRSVLCKNIMWCFIKW